MKTKSLRLSFLGVIMLSILFLLSNYAFATERNETYASDTVAQYSRFEYSFASNREYLNVLYDIKKFWVRFVSPTGRVKTINGFWDGGTNWKIRFCPDEKGSWTWQSFSSDSTNKGLHGIKGSFHCNTNNNPLTIYREGTVVRNKGSYHLQHSSGKPFFWTACTAWNGTLKSTDQEWQQYLQNRSATGYSVIQFVTTQWRGGDKNSLGQVAFEGSGKISLNPDFFKHLDGKIDEINKHGLVAAPVLLWALGSVQGRELSPGYFLPEQEATMLARYMVARYGGNHVIWILGGDGKYTEENEQRWKNIGRGVFGDEHPGVVAHHPGGGSWIGDIYANEDWLDIIGYQSGHGNNAGAINFMTRGPVSKNWNRLPPKVLINMEPVYEEIAPHLKPIDIRNASYWSILNAPTAGISYGADGLWPWLRDGEFILNHAGKGERASRWYKAILLPGSVQVGYLSKFMATLEWWNLRPAPELLVDQPGTPQAASKFVSVSRTTDNKTILVYLPSPADITLYNLQNRQYTANWFDPETNKITAGKIISENGLLKIAAWGDRDGVLVLSRVDAAAAPVKKSKK